MKKKKAAGRNPWPLKSMQSVFPLHEFPHVRLIKKKKTVKNCLSMRRFMQQSVLSCQEGNALTAGKAACFIHESRVQLQESAQFITVAQVWLC